MLSDLPPTPIPASPPRSKSIKLSSPAKAVHKSPIKVSKRSPAKRTASGKSTSLRKTHRVSRISFGSPSKVTSYETELIPPPLAAPNFPSMKPLALASSLLPTSFVLPPPSPRASFPTEPALPPAGGEDHFDLPRISLPSLEISPPSDDSSGPTTPPRPFPVAKPFAQRMIHAYSPARPSPLSRILKLNDSPPLIPAENNTGNSLSPTSIDEGDSAESFERAILGMGSAHSRQPMSLAAELGVSDSPPDTPQEEKKVVLNPLEGKVSRNPKARQPTNSNNADKGRAEPSNKGKVGIKEKENTASKRATSGAPPKKTLPPISKPTNKQAKPSAPSSKQTTTLKPLPGGGPRRVLINSADAPKVRKG